MKKSHILKCAESSTFIRVLSNESWWVRKGQHFLASLRNVQRSLKVQL